MLNQSQTISTLNTSIQKAKSDFQQLTVQNRSMISKMKLDNSQYTDQLVNQRQKNHLIDNQLALNIEKQRRECELIAQKIEIETKKNQDLQNIVQAMQFPQAGDKSDVPNPRAEFPLVQKAVKDAEAKLQQILIKHNEQLAEVEAVKEQLNVGRRERVIYSTVFKGIEKDAILKQREFQNQIRQNELLKTEQKFLEDQLLLIKQLADKEQNEYQQKYEGLFKPPPPKGEESSFVSDKKSSMHNPGPYLTEPGEQKPILQQDNSNSQILEEKDPQQQLIEYEASFNKLFLETGINSVDQILKQYHNQQIWLNDLYDEINELNQEIDATESQSEQLQLKLDKIQHMSKAPIKESVGIVEAPIDRVYRNIDKNKKHIGKIKEDYLNLQKLMGVDIVKKDDDEATLLLKVEQIENLLNNILAVSNQYAQAQKTSPTKVDDRKSLVSTSTKGHDDKSVAPEKVADLDDMLNEVEKKKILAESRHTREELQKESLDYIASVKEKKNTTRRSKNTTQ